MGGTLFAENSEKIIDLIFKPFPKNSPFFKNVEEYDICKYMKENM